MEQTYTKRNIYIFEAGLFQAALRNEGQYVREDVDQLFHIIFKWATSVTASWCSQPAWCNRWKYRSNVDSNVETMQFGWPNRRSTKASFDPIFLIDRAIAYGRAYTTSTAAISNSRATFAYPSIWSIVLKSGKRFSSDNTKIRRATAHDARRRN